MLLLPVFVPATRRALSAEPVDVIVGVQRPEVRVEVAGQRVLDAIVAAAKDYPDCNVSASIGIAWFAKPPDSPAETLQLADDAMYEVKNSGKGKVRTQRIDLPEKPASQTA